MTMRFLTWNSDIQIILAAVLKNEDFRFQFTTFFLTNVFSPIIFVAFAALPYLLFLLQFIIRETNVLPCTGAAFRNLSSEKPSTPSESVPTFKCKSREVDPIKTGPFQGSNASFWEREHPASITTKTSTNQIYSRVYSTRQCVASQRPHNKRCNYWSQLAIVVLIRTLRIYPNKQIVKSEPKLMVLEQLILLRDLETGTR